MAPDLADASVGPELRSLFEAHAAEAQAAVRRRHTHIVAWSDDPGPYGVPRPRSEVEAEVRSLEALAAGGRLTREAALKAARSLAVQAEYMVQARAPGADVQKLNAAFTAHTLQPGSAADLAGKRAVELTVDRLGWLTESPAPGGASAR
jgi:hypothetical protein